MSNVEILGRPLYRPVKHQLQEEQSPLVQLKSKTSKSTLTYIDLLYERDVSEENYAEIKQENTWRNANE